LVDRNTIRWRIVKMLGIIIIIWRIQSLIEGSCIRVIGPYRMEIRFKALGNRVRLIVRGMSGREVTIKFKIRQTSSLTSIGPTHKEILLPQR
jgi:hypothetical protein